jgi:hypothetical protein
MTERVEHYLGTLRVLNGEVVAEDQKQLENFRWYVRGLNSGFGADRDEYGCLGRFRALRRYRGPRAKTRRNRQSMCLRSEATSVDVYAYRERIWQ